MPKAMYIKKWHESHENSYSRERKELTYAQWPVRLNSVGRIRLMATPAGREALAVYGAIVSFAASVECPVRGVLAGEHGPYSPDEIASMINCAPDAFASAIAMLMSTEPGKEIGWVGEVEWPFQWPPQTKRPEIGSDGLRTRSKPVRAKAKTTRSNHVRTSLEHHSNAFEHDSSDVLTLNEAEAEKHKQENSSPSSSPSDTREPDQATVRLRAFRLRWQPELGDGFLAPAGSQQHRSDKTSVQNLFDAYVWPPGTDVETGERNLNHALTLVKKARTSDARPMQFLTGALKKAAEKAAQENRA